MVPAPPEFTQVFGMVELPPLRGPHLVLADPRDDDRVVGRLVPQALDDELGLQHAFGRSPLVGEREARSSIRRSAPSRPTDPLAAGAIRRCSMSSSREHRLDHRPAVAGDRQPRPCAPCRALRGRCRRGSPLRRVRTRSPSLSPCRRSGCRERSGGRPLHRGDRGVGAVHAGHPERRAGASRGTSRGS